MTRMKFLPPAVAAICMSLAPCIHAQTTLDQQKRTARILGDGTIETGTGWISSPVTHSTTGLWGLTFTKPFTAPPNCVAQAEAQNGTSNFVNALIVSNVADPQSLTGITVQVFDQGLNGVDTPFRISCVPDQTTATSSARWDAAGNLLSGGDWLNNPSNSSTGFYTATFMRPYLSAPVCVASVYTSTFSVAQVFTTTTAVNVYTQSVLGTALNANRGVNLICVGPQ